MWWFASKKFHICLEFRLQKIWLNALSPCGAMFLKWIEHSKLWHLETIHLIRNWNTAINDTGAIVISPFRPLMDIVTIYKYIINWTANMLRESAWVVIWPDRATVRIVTDDWARGWIDLLVEIGMCKKLQGISIDQFWHHFFFDNILRQVRSQLLKNCMKKCFNTCLKRCFWCEIKRPIKSANQRLIPPFLNKSFPT